MTRLFFKLTIAASLIAVAAPGSSVAEAQSEPSTSLNRFSAGQTPEDDFHISRASDFGHLRFGAQLHLDYAMNPLVYEATLGMPGTEEFAVVANQLNADVGLSLGLGDRVVIYAGLPVVLMMDGEEASAVTAIGGLPSDGPGLGDAYLGGRVRLFGEDEDVGALALQVTGTFPTGAYEQQNYRSEDHVTIVPELIGELRPGADSRIVINAGVRIRNEQSSTNTNFEIGHELTYGLGFAMPVWSDEVDNRTHLDVAVQAYGATTFALAATREGTALEALVGMRFFHSSGVVAGLAGGPGLNRGFGSPDLRMVLQLGWMVPDDPPYTPPTDRDGDGLNDDVDGCPDEPEDADQFEDEDGCPDPDNDQDGILDPADRCPNEPETQNNWEDEDGCPDEVPDSDGDGLTDDVDQCRDDPEDADGFQDEDGCPDPDNDEDGVMDASDNCPLEPGPVENRGCPDQDRDEDTVVDRLDNCPDEPGTVENHGCQERQQVRITGGRLDILDRVYFRTNSAVILRRSHSLLRNVAAVINSHPEIPTIRVEGHTDSRGRRERNMTLSQERAQSVVTFLTEAGVDAGRLQARGYGPDRPVVENASSREEHAQNRRVEFHLPGDTEGIEQQDSGPSEEAADR